MVVLLCHHISISIHALLAESDSPVSVKARGIFISIHALLAESDVDCQQSNARNPISIHALLAESDAGRALYVRLH